MQADWEQRIRPYAAQQGAKVFGTLGKHSLFGLFWRTLKDVSNFLGTCWGSYVVVRLSSYTDFKAGVSLHPSHSPIIDMLGESEEDILKDIKCPQMFMPGKIKTQASTYFQVKRVNHKTFFQLVPMTRTSKLEDLARIFLETVLKLSSSRICNMVGQWEEIW